MKRPQPWPLPPPPTVLKRVEPTETWFIERLIDINVWSRYAGAFDTYERAKLYFDALCPRDYRITQYVPRIP